MTTKIALVDDSLQDLQILSQMISNYFSGKNCPVEMITFTSAESFLSSFHPKQYDIVFLDIYMSDLTGMDAAVEIRKKDADCKIIFLTSSQDYLLEGYSVNASHYLLKPLSSEKLEEALNFCRIGSDALSPSILVEIKKNIYQIELNKIYYIDIQNRKVHIHLKNKDIPVTGSFRDITKDLSDNEHFLQPIQGVMVNMDMIEHEDNNYFILKNGEKVPINIRNRKSIINIYFQYLFKQVRDF